MMILCNINFEFHFAGSGEVEWYYVIASKPRRDQRETTSLAGPDVINCPKCFRLG